MRFYNTSAKNLISFQTDLCLDTLATTRRILSDKTPVLPQNNMRMAKRTDSFHPSLLKKSQSNRK